MKITVEEVEYVARLAYLTLSEEEKDKFTLQLNSILEYMDKLNELDTTEVEPTSHVLPILNVFRGDEVKDSRPIEEMLQNAPERELNYIRVPRVVE
jgi:aspartyl-tRNA(Asn)/glutamyl-tRNA(Gln) amidotransferase subunit C